MPLARKYRLGDRPVVVWVFPDPAPFLLPNGVAFNSLTPLVPEIQFSAISPNQPGMNYTVISGAPPFGTTFTNGFGANADFAFLSGVVQAGPSPNWISPADGALLATLGELEDITPLNISLNAGPTPPASSIGYYVFSGALPSGILLDFNTGDLTGVANQLVGVFSPDFNVNPPTWVSPAAGAVLGPFDEGSAVNLSGWQNVSFFGTPTDTNYYLVDGRLPFGLTMDYNSGDISGQLDILVNVPPPNNNPPTVAPLTANVTSGVATTIPVSITPAAGETYSFAQILDGQLPFGLFLDGTVPEIAGTTTQTGTFTGTLRGYTTPAGFANAPFTITVS